MIKNEKFNLDDATKLWRAGKVVLVGKWVKGEISKQSIRDKATGGRRDAFVARQVILNAEGDDILTINQWLPDGENDSNYQFPAQKGDLVCVIVQEMQMLAGTPSITKCEIRRITV